MALNAGTSDSIVLANTNGVVTTTVQGLNQKLEDEKRTSRAKDAKINAQGREINALQRANDAMQRELTAIKKKLGL